MKKIYSTLLLACMSLTAFAQEGNDTTYVMLDFNENPWNYPVREVTTGWAPDAKDVEGVGSILEPTDFSWPISEGSSEKVKVTVYPVDLDEFNKVAVYASSEINDAEAASFGITPGNKNILFTQPGTTMRFEAPEGYQFGKMVFYNFHSPNFLVGDEYEEEHSYQYDGSTFKHKLKFWTPNLPKVKEYPQQSLRYDMWDGDAKNILFDYPYFTAHFVKIDIRLVSDGSAGIEEISNAKLVMSNDDYYRLDGRMVNKDTGLRKGIYIQNGKKVIVK